MYRAFLQHALYAIFLPRVCCRHVMLFVPRILLVIVAVSLYVLSLISSSEYYFAVFCCFILFSIIQNDSLVTWCMSSGT
jgi:hypothetical protein